MQPMRRNLSAYLSEFAGTAIMLFIGVSAVAFMWAPGSPVSRRSPPADDWEPS